MNSYIAVTFQHLDRDPSIEAAIHRGVARFEAMRFEVQQAAATVARVGRRRVTVRLTLALMNGAAQTASATHDDAFLAVSDAFRVVQHQLLAVAQPALAQRASRAAAHRLVA